MNEPPLDDASWRSPPGAVRSERYDRTALRESVLHVGVGAFHRAHQARYLDELMARERDFRWGICGASLLPGDQGVHRALSTSGGLYTLSERDDDARQTRIVGSIRRHLWGGEQREAILDRIADPATRLITTTVSEAGYCTDPATQGLDADHPGVQRDLLCPGAPSTLLGYLSEGLARRRDRKAGPVTLLCCDNLQENGRVLRRALSAFAELRGIGLGRYLDADVRFPCSMVDRITPRATDADRAGLRAEHGINDPAAVFCEPFRQWVVEDDFAAERPRLEAVGVVLTADVRPYETMKIRLLNASHSALGYLGYLCGYRFIHEIARDADFEAMLRVMMDDEVRPTIGEVPGVDLGDYQRSVRRRFKNASLGDTALRICSDGSAKIPGFVLPSIRDQLARGGPIETLCLCVASWIVFLSRAGRAGGPEVIDDPLASELSARARESLSDPSPFLGQGALLGDLGASADFRRAVATQLERLGRAGPRAAVRAAATPVKTPR